MSEPIDPETIRARKLSMILIIVTMCFIALVFARCDLSRIEKMQPCAQAKP